MAEAGQTINRPAYGEPERPGIRRGWSRWGGYLVALLLPVLALLARRSLDPWLEDFQIWSFFYLAVLLSAWWLGWRPAVLAASAGLVLGWYGLMPPRLTWRVPRAHDWLGLATYAVVAGAMVLLVRTARQQQQRLHHAAQGLAQELGFSQAVIDSLPGLFYMLDEQGRLRRWNKQMETLTGYAAAELEGKPGTDLVPAEERPPVLENMREVFTRGYSQVELHLLTRAGRRIPHFFTGRRFTYGHRTGLVGMGTDMTERKQAEAARATLAAIIEHASDAIVGESVDGTITSWNQGAERVFGYTAQEALGRHVSMLAPAEAREEITENLERLRRGEVVERTEAARVRKDGRRITVSYSVSPIRDAAGRVTGIAQMAHDVTQLKAAEAKLRHQEQLLRQVLALLPVGVWLMDKSGHIVEQNPAGAQIWGRPQQVRPDQFGAYKGWWAATGQRIAPEEWAAARAIAKGEVTLKEEVFIEAFDGVRKTMLNSALPLRDEQGEISGGIIVNEDITFLKQAEMALTQQNHRLALLQETAVHLLATPELERILPGIFDRIAQYFQADIFVEFGLSPTGQGLDLRTCGGLDDATRRQIQHLDFGQGACGIVAQFRQPIVRTRIQDSAEPMVQLVRQWGVRTYACTPLLVEGRLYGTLSFGSRLRDSFEPEDLAFFQTLAGCVALGRERADLVAELRRHTQELEQRVEERTGQWREAMSELEQMSYSMIHDLRAPLRAIVGFGSLLAGQAERGLGAEGRDLVEKMRTAALRMDHLVQDTLNYNRTVREALPLRPVDLGALARGILQTYPDFQPPHVQVSLAPELPTVMGNEAALTQCLSHLLRNAVEFAKPDIQPQIRIWAETLSPLPSPVASRDPSATEPAPRSPPQASPAPFVRLWVEDNGIGIELAAQGTLFKLFQRLSTQGSGTGMGLAIVKKAVEHMGGRVGVESTPGQGSRFWVELRKAEG